MIESLKRVLTNSPVGTLQSVRSVVDDYVFDYRNKLDTRTEVAINDLDISQEDKQHADKYKPTRARYFRKLMTHIGIPHDGVFVDVGCGKGRILLLAAEYGFERIVGLEISPQLCQIAERNVNAFRQRTNNACSVNVVCTNILHYQLKGDESVFFLYSPFDHPVTKGFLDLLRKSIDDHPRTLHLIIDEFRFPELLENDEYFSHTGTYTYGAAEFQIYLHEA